jgi:cobalt/nickel transport system permease protein
MQHDFLDRYSRLDSPVHRVRAGYKSVVALATILTIVVTPRSHPALFIGVALALLGLAVLSRVPGWFLIRRLLWLEPLVLGVSALAIFQPDGGRVFAFLVVRSTLCLGTMILLSATTPFSELLGLMRRVRVPGLLITTLALMYRYLFVLMEEAERMRRARASRSFSASRPQLWGMLGWMLGQLFIRASERAERIYAAMCARGWK